MIAIIETVAIILLVSPWYIIGAIITLSIISAANFLHFTRLGLVVNDDGGTLFILSIIVIFCSLWIVLFWNMRRVERKTANFQFHSEDVVLMEDDLDEITP